MPLVKIPERLKEEKKNNNSIPCFLYLSPSLKFFVLVVAASNKKREEREREREKRGWPKGGIRKGLAAV